MAAQKLYSGEKLKQIRMAHGLSQKDFAARLAVSTPYINQMENNNRPLSAGVMLGLAAEFGIDIRDLGHEQASDLQVNLATAARNAMFDDDPIPSVEIGHAAAHTPALARAFILMQDLLSQSLTEPDKVRALVQETTSEPTTSVEQRPEPPEPAPDGPGAKAKTGEPSSDQSTPEPEPASVTQIDVPQTASDSGNLAAGEAIAHAEDEDVETSPPAATMPDAAGTEPDVPLAMPDPGLETTSTSEFETQTPEQGSGINSVAATDDLQDFFDAQDGYIDEIDRTAEDFVMRTGTFNDATLSAIAALADVGVSVEISAIPHARRFEPARNRLVLSSHLSVNARRFQLLRHVALLAEKSLLAATLDRAAFTNPQTRALAEIGLANYFAAAALMPYETFRETALDIRHDLDALAYRFGVSVEQAAHRLSTLNRPGEAGLPFRFERIDSAFETTDGQRIGAHTGSDGMPAGDLHRICMAPHSLHRRVAFSAAGTRVIAVAGALRPTLSPLVKTPSPDRAFVLSCDIAFAPDLIYADGLDLFRTGRFIKFIPTYDARSRDSYEWKSTGKRAVHVS